MFFSSKAGGGGVFWSLHFTAYLNLAPRLRKGEVVLLPPLYALMPCSGTTLHNKFP